MFDMGDLRVHPIAWISTNITSLGPVALGRQAHIKKESEQGGRCTCAMDRHRSTQLPRRQQEHVFGIANLLVGLRWQSVIELDSLLQ